MDHAGLTEAGPFGSPCPDGHGLHVLEDEFVCEILDDELQPVDVGQRGELVLTPLRRTGFPVLRYRTGDAVVNTDERCPAGHEGRWLPGGIVGRTDDMVVIRGMNVYPSAIEEAVRHVSGSGEFRITFYSEPSGMDEIKLEVELDEGSGARAAPGDHAPAARPARADRAGHRRRAAAARRQVAAGGRRALGEAGGTMSTRPRRSRPRGRNDARAIRGASEQVAIQIQHYIQEEGLGPDDFLGREEDLASEFGVSRPTLREALKLLASGNLIRATKGPGGGIFVARTADQGMSRSLSDAIAMMLETGAVTLEELVDARLLLEVPLAGLAAYQPDEAMLRRLREAVAAEVAAVGDSETLAATDMEIHRTIAAAGSNRMVQALTDWIFEVVQPSLIEVLEPAIVHSAVLEQHQALLAAVEKGDSARAERAMKDHLLYLRDVLRMVQPEQPPAVDARTAG